MKNSPNKNLVYTFIYQVSIILIALILIPYVSRVLGKEGVGMHSFSYAICSYFVLVAQLAFNLYGRREIAKYHSDKYQQSVVFWEIIFCRLITVFFATTINLVLFFLNVYGKYGSLMLLFTIDIVAIAFDVTFFFHGKDEYGKVVLIGLITKILIVTGIFIFVKSPEDILIYIGIYSILGLLCNLLLWCFLGKKLVKVKLKDLKPLRHFKSCLLLCIPGLVTGVYNLIDNTLIGAVTHSDIQNGFYAQSEKIVTKSIAVVGCFNFVMFSRSVKIASLGNKEELKNNIYTTIRMVWLISIPMLFGIILSANNFVPWFLSSEFIGAILILKVLAIKIPISNINSVICEQYLLATRSDKKYIWAILCGGIVSFILNIPLIYQFGALGTAIAAVIAEVLVLIILLCIVAKDLSLKKIFVSLFKPLLSSLVMCLAIYPLCMLLVPSVWNTLIIIGVGVIVYVTMVLLLREPIAMACLRTIFKMKTKKNNIED